jgi:hypothetical protein
LGGVWSVEIGLIVGKLSDEAHSFAAHNLRALAMTEIELKLIAPAAIIGFSSRPNTEREIASVATTASR